MVQLLLFSSTNTLISDNLLELNNGAGSNANDSGLVIERGSTGDNAFIGWDESSDKFIVGTNNSNRCKYWEFIYYYWNINC